MIGVCRPDEDVRISVWCLSIVPCLDIRNDRSSRRRAEHVALRDVWDILDHASYVHTNMYLTRWCKNRTLIGIISLTKVRFSRQPTRTNHLDIHQSKFFVVQETEPSPRINFRARNSSIGDVALYKIGRAHV